MITHTDSDELDNELFKFWQFWPDHAVWVKRIYLMYLAFYIAINTAPGDSNTMSAMF